jgi:hypothetical protein
VRSSRFLTGALAVLVIATHARAGSAGDRDPFDEQVSQAQARYQARDYEGAIVSLEAAYQRKPVARLLFNLGMAHRKLGHLEEALDCFERFRAARSAVDQDVPVDRYIDEVSRELARARSPDSTPPPPAPAPPTLPQARSAPPSASPPPPTTAGMPSLSAAAPPSLRVPAPAPRRRAWPWIALAIGVAAGAGAAVWLATAPGGAGSGTLPDIGPGAASSSPLVTW